MIFKLEQWANREGGALRDVIVPDTAFDDMVGSSLEQEQEQLCIIKYHALNPPTNAIRPVLVGDIIQLIAERWMIDRDSFFLRQSPLGAIREKSTYRQH